MADGVERKLSDIQVAGEQLAWSPDGSRIAFAAWQDGDQDIYAIELATDATGNLTQHEGEDMEPQWSPDGMQMVFSSDRDGNREVYVLDLTSGTLRNLSEHEYTDQHPAWSLDGHQIAFQSWRSRNAEIYVADLDTGMLHKISDSHGHNIHPRWPPRRFNFELLASLWQMVKPASRCSTEYGYSPTLTHE